MSKTFSVIRDIVKRFDLNANGFTRIEVVQHVPSGTKKRTVQVFIGKHAKGGGETPTLYFQKIAPDKYKILPEYMTNG